MSFDLAVTALVFNEADRILMIRSVSRDVWELPGGRVEPDETPAQAVRREVLEESGFMVSSERFLCAHFNRPRSLLVLGFRCRLLGGAMHRSAESSAVAWVAKEKILALPLRESMRVRIEDMLSDAPCYRAYQPSPYMESECLVP